MVDVKGTEDPQQDITHPGPTDGWQFSPLLLARAPAVPSGVARRELSAWNMNPSWLGEQSAFDMEFGDRTFYRYQYDVLYIYRRRVGKEEHEYFPVEFRTYINSAEPIPEATKRHFRLHDNARLQNVFDSGPYQGYMRGFNFWDKKTRVEDDTIAADEANNLGIPQFEVILHQEGQVTGHAGGFFDPWAIVRGIPKQEEWKVTRNEARRDYEFRPQDRARQRLMGERKAVYLNGKYIGNIVPTRGTVWLSFDYPSNDNTWKDSHTGQQMWSRRKFIEEDILSPAAVAAGGKVYKTSESAEAIRLVATKPEDWQPTPAETVPVEAGEAARLRWGRATDFLIMHDTGPMMGKYDTPTVVSESEGTDLML